MKFYRNITVQDVLEYQNKVARRMKKMILFSYLIGLIALPVSFVVGAIRTYKIHPNHILGDGIIFGVLWAVILICFINTYKIGK